MPSEITIIQSDPMYTTKTGDTYVWELDSIMIGEVREIIIVDSVSTEATVGDSVEIQSSLMSAESELDLTDNSMSFREMIVGPIDPNDMIATPVGIGPEHLIKKNQYITYKIRFQNVGNYPAHYVFIEDEIFYPLNIETVEFVAASHKCDFMINQNKLCFRFDGINLPDSTSDETGSHGFVIFKLRPYDFAESKDIIQNQAAIQFDFENPILTNKIQHKILSSNLSNNEITFIPNPAGDYTLVVGPEDQLQNINNVEIYTTAGNQVKIPYELLNNSIMIHTHSTPKGIYLVRISTADSIFSGKLIICNGKESPIR